MLKQSIHPECSNCAVRHKSIFCDLTPHELSSLTAAKTYHFYKKGQVIFQEDTPSFGLYCVNSGKLKLSRLGDEGKEQILHLVKAGDVLGYRSVLSGDLQSCTATALDDAGICFIPKEVFFEIVQSNGNLALKIIKQLSDELRLAEKSITDIAQKPVRERVAEALIFLRDTYGQEEDGQTLNVSLSREEIANIVGTATESAIRVLSELKQDGIILLNGRKISILKFDALLKTANLADYVTV